MNFQRVLALILGVMLLIAAWRIHGWAGLAFVVTGMVMWALLHLTRAMQVLRRAAARPIGYVDSAVMLNAKLKTGASLLHVLAMTRALGEQLSFRDEQPEIYRWSDGTQSHVSCEFKNGKLVKWTLSRPSDSAHKAPSPAP